ncbi:STAS-like domain-containing protein [uncultured Polaribacter sp.]|jgi:hypothetical protein|uniref:STAS-like domain-containing protein n=1 Tax=uncultured Polaribacter sp. TaxID=174711 RepID=UPI00260BEDEA|nr:STAS-like domain-containing protein [uncultured Polaribacter sp.]
MNLEINIALDFSETPGARYKTDGDFSGEDFFEKILEPKFLKIKDTKNVLFVNLDNTAGYATSFLDEAFGGLARKYGKELVLQKINFVSIEEPYLIEEIKSYMNE